MNAAKVPGVLQVSTADVAGGAERIALQLHLAYLAQGTPSVLAVGSRRSEHPGIVEIDHASRRPAWKRGMLEGLGPSAPRGNASWLADRAMRTLAAPIHMLEIQRGHEDFDYPATADLPSLAPVAGSVLHLHNLHGGYFDLRQLPALSARMPTVLTLHDSWLFTGHCAHPIDCDRWLHGCGDCPDLDIIPAIRRDGTRFNLERKRGIYERSHVRIAAPSAWLLERAQRSILAPALVDARVIPNGVDTSVFAPGDQAAARVRLGIAPQVPVLLFAANALAINPFKDFATLANALSALRAEVPGLTLIALGGEPPASGAPEGVHFVPFVDDSAVVADYYRAADVYVHPALAESFGLSIVEAMACERPVVATSVGGIPEIVVDGVTGLLVPPRDAQALSATLGALLRDSVLRHAMGATGRDRVLERFTFEAQVQAYLDFYREATESFTSA